MAGNLSLRNKQLTDYGAVMATATLTIYSGTVPASADAALSGNTPLAAHTLTGFVPAASGSMTANSIANSTIINTGTASFCRLVAGLYTEQLLVGTAGTPVIVNSASYTAGGISKITSLTLTKA